MVKKDFRRSVKIILVLLIAALLLGSLAGCKKKEKGANEATIGFMTSLSGTFAGVGETQRKAYVYAIEELNEKGGLEMPWGKVKINTAVADDEAKLDIGVPNRIWLKKV